MKKGDGSHFHLFKVKKNPVPYFIFIPLSKPGDSIARNSGTSCQTL